MLYLLYGDKLMFFNLAVSVFNTPLIYGQLAFVGGIIVILGVFLIFSRTTR